MNDLKIHHNNTFVEPLFSQTTHYYSVFALTIFLPVLYREYAVILPSVKGVLLQLVWWIALTNYGADKAAGNGILDCCRESITLLWVYYDKTFSARTIVIQSVSRFISAIIYILIQKLTAISLSLAFSIEKVSISIAVDISTMKR